MQRTLPLLNGHVSLRSALDDDDNVLQELSYPEKRIEFFAYLLMQRDTIENIVSFHLGLKRKQTCRIGEVKEWISGSFNVCIPVYINHWPAANRVLIRFPLPYKVGELEYPGNAEEKLRCEAATFIWLQENCPSVPIPNIWGFGLANGHSFTALGRVSFLSRLMWNLRRIASSIFHYSVPCRYVSRQCSYKLKSPYLVMDYIDSTQGVMLSESWEGLRHDQTRRKNLFRGLSRIILALARLPFERIGSLTIDNRSVIRLKNRPLTLRLQHLENQSVPTSIDRDIIYHSTDAYLLDLLAYHDSYLRHSPNSVQDELDGQAQLSTLTIMRAILPHFINRDFRRGPFVLSLTDLHQSNIFVDQNWNIKCLVDLEWACSRPVEMLHPPYWLTSRGVDQLEEGEHLDAFNNMHSEFMDAFAKEEESLFEKDARAFSLTDIIKWGLENGSFWYYHALDNPKGLYNIFLGHIQPIFAKLDDAGVDKLEQMVAPYWSADMQSFLAKKLKDQEEYQNKVRDAFAVSESDPKTNANPHTQ